ncbi:unnamed protein product [Amoebophrya sp. A25]|nr:unnamed protein product [Amoebophrya sp. A25]|eukprot:GSA25T00025283001.1
MKKRTKSEKIQAKAAATNEAAAAPSDKEAQTNRGSSTSTSRSEKAQAGTAPEPSSSSLFGADSSDSDADVDQKNKCQNGGASGSAGFEKLSVNRKFAEKFEKRKDAEELAYARRTLEEEGARSSDSEDSDSEDDDARLLGNDVGSKVLDTLQRIRNRDASIYDGKTQFFRSGDFFAERRTEKRNKGANPAEDDKSEDAAENANKDKGTTSSSSSTTGGAKKKSADGPILYKDLLRETLLEGGADAFERDEQELRRRAKESGTDKNAAELAEIKAEIRRGAFNKEEDDSDDGEDDGGLFTVVKKHAGDKDADDAETGEQTHDRETSSASGVNLARKKSSRALLADKYWGAEEKLSENEKFLRDYILNEGWKDPTGKHGFSDAPGGASGRAKDQGGDDSEDSEDLAAQDEFEADYNFRYEHAGLGERGEIPTYSRSVPNSVRQVDDKRRRKRVERKERKAAEAVRKSEELKRLRNLKRKELQRRLRQIEKTTGKDGSLVASETLQAEAEKYDKIFENEDDEDSQKGSEENTREKSFAKLLEQDYDPENYEREMAAYLGEDFEAAAETLDPKALKELTREGEHEEDWGDCDGEDWAEEVGEDRGAYQEGDDSTWQEQEGGRSCDDQNQDHYGDQVEDDASMKVDDNDENNEMWFLCDECQETILPGKNFYESVQKADFTLCQKCFKSGKKRKEKFQRKKVPGHCQPPADWTAEDSEKHFTAKKAELTSAKGGAKKAEMGLRVANGATEENDEDDPNSIYKIRDFGGVKFQYSRVKGDNFNLSVEDILARPDKELNRKATLKKVTRPYWDTSTYTDERTERYEAAKKELRKQKRKKPVKMTGLDRDRLKAYQVKAPILVKKTKKET